MQTPKLPFTIEFRTPFGDDIKLKSECRVDMHSNEDETITVTSLGLVEVYHEEKLRYICKGGAYAFGEGVKVESSAEVTTICFGIDPFDDTDEKLHDFARRCVIEYLDLNTEETASIVYKGLLIAADGGTVNSSYYKEDGTLQTKSITSYEGQIKISAMPDAYAIINDDGVKHSLKYLTWSGDITAEWRPGIYFLIKKQLRNRLH